MAFEVSLSTRLLSMDKKVSLKRSCTYNPTRCSRHVTLKKVYVASQRYSNTVLDSCTKCTRHVSAIVDRSVRFLFVKSSLTIYSYSKVVSMLL
jgi:hypothetical protein